MKIVIDARESGTSTGRYVDKLVEYLHKLKSGDDFVILTKTHRLDFFKEIAPEFMVKRCDIKEFSFAEQYSFVWMLYGIKNNLVHFAKTEQPVLYFGKKVTTIHDLTTAYYRNPAKNRIIFWIKQRIYRLVIKRVAKSSAKIIVPSKYVKQQLAEFTGIDRGKIIVTYEATDKINQPAEPMADLAGKIFILYVGRPQPHKNLERLVQAFAKLVQANPELKLVLAGKKDLLYSRLESFAKKQGIPGIVFTDFVSEGQLRWLYENTSAYVFPSLSEGFGLPGLEAMAHGTPVVSSNASCLPEIYGEAALYLDPLDVNDIADKVSRVLADPKLAKKLSAAGLKQSARYSWQLTAEQTMKVYIETNKKRG